MINGRRDLLLNITGAIKEYPTHSYIPATILLSAVVLNKIFDTILFDLDDTLLVELKSAEEAFAETVEILNSHIDKNEFVKSIIAQARINWYKLPAIEYCLRIGISSREGLWADFTGENENLKILRSLSVKYRLDTWHETLIKFGINDPAIAEKLSCEFIRIRNNKHVLFPEVKDVLDKLKDRFKLGLITNGTPDVQWNKINGGNLKQYFKFIAVSGEQGYAKPDRRLFDIVISGLNSDKSAAIMIGDSINTDIKGAKDYGISTVWINRNKVKSDSIKPDYEITNLTGILKILSAKKI